MHFYAAVSLTVRKRWRVVLISWDPVPKAVAVLRDVGASPVVGGGLQ